VRTAKIAELFVYDNFSRVPVEEVAAGDICALSGIPDIKIGETITQREAPVPLPTIKVRPSSRVALYRPLAALSASRAWLSGAHYASLSPCGWSRAVRRVDLMSMG
jgi:hypothetical protein